MAQKWKLENVKGEIDGEGYGAYRWKLSCPLDKPTVKISCHGLTDAPRLSIDKNPNPSLLLVDGCGVELRYATKLVKIKTCERIDGILQIDYFFEVTG